MLDAEEEEDGAGALVAGAAEVAGAAVVAGAVVAGAAADVGVADDVGAGTVGAWGWPSTVSVTGATVV